MSHFDFRLSADGSHIFPLAEIAIFELERELHMRFPAAFQWYEISQSALMRLLGRGFTFC
jgi:hypothetical protein